MLWLETGFDVCREGYVSFSHPANQNHAGGSNPKPLGSWVILRLPHLKKPDKRECGYPTLVIRGNVAKLRQIFFFFF